MPSKGTPGPVDVEPQPIRTPRLAKDRHRPREQRIITSNGGYGARREHHELAGLRRGPVCSGWGQEEVSAPQVDAKEEKKRAAVEAKRAKKARNKEAAAEAKALKFFNHCDSR